MKILIAPSIIAADFSKLAEEIKKVEAAGADLLHIDIMDGHFVPNITFGPGQVEAIKKVSGLPLDVHLMIENPFKFLNDFIKAGADIITVHIETVSTSSFKSQLKKIKGSKVRLGAALNPNTSLKKIEPIIDLLDFVLLMSVNPGFCGQKFMPIVYSKITGLRKKFRFDIEVDGGVNSENGSKLVSCGANVLAAGSFIFNATDANSAIRSLRG
ncbi:MAG: ribulose-phosphate 3-epimerase [Candidatus Omnitrophota bacterium]